MDALPVPGLGRGMPLEKPTYQSGHCAFANGNIMLAIAEPVRAILMTLPNREEIASFEVNDSPFVSCDVTEDGTCAVTISQNGMLRTWCAASGRQIWNTRPNGVLIVGGDCKIADDAGLVVASFNDFPGKRGVVFAFNIETGARIWSQSYPNLYVKQVVVARDSHVYAVAGVTEDKSKALVYIDNPPKDPQERVHVSCIVSLDGEFWPALAMDALGRTLLIRGAYQTKRVTIAPAYEEIDLSVIPGSGKRQGQIALSSDGIHAYACLNESVYMLVNVVNKCIVRVCPIPAVYCRAVNRCVLSRTNAFLSLSSTERYADVLNVARVFSNTWGEMFYPQDGPLSLRIRDEPFGKFLRRLFVHTPMASPVAISGNGIFALFGCCNGHTALWNQCNETWEAELDEADETITSAALDFVGNYAATTTINGSVRCYDIRRKERMWVRSRSQWSVQGFDDIAWDCNFAYESDALIVAFGNDCYRKGEITIFSLSDGRIRTTLPLDRFMPFSCAISSSADLCAYSVSSATSSFVICRRLDIHSETRIECEHALNHPPVVSMNAAGTLLSILDRAGTRIHRIPDLLRVCQVLPRSEGNRWSSCALSGDGGMVIAPIQRDTFVSSCLTHEPRVASTSSMSFQGEVVRACVSHDHRTMLMTTTSSVAKIVSFDSATIKINLRTGTVSSLADDFAFPPGAANDPIVYLLASLAQSNMSSEGH